MRPAKMNAFGCGGGGGGADERMVRLGDDVT